VTTNPCDADSSTIYYSNPAGGFPWELHYGYFTVPANVDRWIPYAYLNSATPFGDVVYIDDIIIHDAVAKTVVDDIVQQLYGWGDIGYSTDQAGQALGQALGPNGTLVSNSNEIQNLWNAVYAASAIADDFERTDTSGIGANWEENYGGGNGHLWCDGHNATWYDVFPYGDRNWLARYVGSGAQSVTDYQTIVAVLGGACESSNLGGYDGSIDLIGRCNSAKTSYIRFRISADDSWTLNRVVGGSETNIASGSVSNPGAGSSLTLICGQKSTSTPRYFTVKVNSTVLWQGAEPGGTSSYGASYRYRGFAGRTEGVLLAFGTDSGAPVNLWMSYDS
jgi:hypothetical protein